MAVNIYFKGQVLDSVSIITGAKTELLTLCSVIFKTRDLSKVEQKISDASKIRIGLLALDLQQEELTIQQKQDILITLANMSSLYNQQIIPTIN